MRNIVLAASVESGKEGAISGEMVEEVEGTLNVNSLELGIGSDGGEDRGGGESADGGAAGTNGWLSAGFWRGGRATGRETVVEGLKPGG